MKDKVCSEFVFMPLKGNQRVPPMAAGGAPVAAAGSAAVVEAESTEVKSKIVVVGDCECGKTTLIHRYVQSKFQETYTPTGFDTYSGSYNVSDTYSIHMSIWDTSGDSGYDRVRPLSYSDADLVIICFSIASPESMENVVSKRHGEGKASEGEEMGTALTMLAREKCEVSNASLPYDQKWHPEVREHCPTQPIMLVGCKADLRSEAKNLPPGTPRPPLVSYDQGLKTAKHIGALVYSETSAKTSQRSVNDVMEVAALSSAGTTGNGAAAAAGATTVGNGAASGTDSADSSFGRQRSFIRRKRFSGLNEAKAQLRKEAAKSCVVM